ncbi:MULTISPECIES: hypothetical protein [unclassified Streptomyces]|uniref:hypothetical protein n=1 Tax=unclassified Streptomyces TaxID=2593676 RepID=UPI000DD83D33|nr:MULTISPECIES: hypothetical protein [unclassified Streptomyces]QZZ26925.1 hypothetical protein A7X85_12230 [Streptomyces sp. ST1015]
MPGSSGQLANTIHTVLPCGNGILYVGHSRRASYAASTSAASTSAGSAPKSSKWSGDAAR